MAEQKSFIVYYSFVEASECLTDGEFGRVMRAMCHYARTGEEPELPRKLLVAFRMSKYGIDENIKKFNETCQRNKEKALKRWNKERNKADALYDNCP